MDVLAFFADPYIPGFSFPKEVYWAMPLVGFVVANVKLFAEVESEKQLLQDYIALVSANLKPVPICGHLWQKSPLLPIYGATICGTTKRFCAFSAIYGGTQNFTGK
jgi:hypothetical protein